MTIPPRELEREPSEPSEFRESPDRGAELGLPVEMETRNGDSDTGGVPDAAAHLAVAAQMQQLLARQDALLQHEGTLTPAYAEKLREIQRETLVQMKEHLAIAQESLQERSDF